MTYKCNVLFVPGRTAPVAREQPRRLPLSFAACTRILAYSRASAHARVHMHTQWQRTPVTQPDTDTDGSVCVPALLCVTRIIRALAPARLLRAALI